MNSKCVCSMVYLHKHYENQFTLNTVVDRPDFIINLP